MPGNKADEILAVMYDLSAGEPQYIDYDDIVVGAFKRFPQDFSLRKYPEFPDASDVHKPLYGPLKSRGLVVSREKRFSLTDKGFEEAARLAGATGHAPRGPAKRLDRSQEHEIDRILRLEAYQLFAGGKADQVVDTDLYYYLAATVRTDRGGFLGRLTTVEGAVKAAEEVSHPRAEQLRKFHDHMVSRYANIIEKRKGSA